MISAEDARGLSSRMRVMSPLEAMIVSSAKEGMNSIRVPGDFVYVDASSIRFKDPLVEETLAAAGYEVLPKYLDTHFAHLEVSW